MHGEQKPRVLDSNVNVEIKQNIENDYVQIYFKA